MKFLSVKDLHACAQVCKRWNELSVHPSLWKHMDLAKNRLTSKYVIEYQIIIQPINILLIYVHSTLFCYLLNLLFSLCRSLVAIVRRQPALLNVSWTSLSRDQMDWLLPRIPSTKGLYVRGLAIASLKVSRFCITCLSSYLRTLFWWWWIAITIHNDLITQLIT